MTKIGGFGDVSKYLKREATPPGGERENRAVWFRGRK